MSATPEDVFASHEERQPGARAALKGKVNGVTVFLDVDDTVLKEVDLKKHRDKDTVQLITYKPSEYVMSTIYTYPLLTQVSQISTYRGHTCTKLKKKDMGSHGRRSPPLLKLLRVGPTNT